MYDFGLLFFGLHYVVDYEGRSANSRILILICDCISKYEEVSLEKRSDFSKKDGDETVLFCIQNFHFQRHSSININR